MAVQWVESALIITSYGWQWTQPIESDWIRVRSSQTVEMVADLAAINEARRNRGRSAINLWGMICQGANSGLGFQQKFQQRRLYLNPTQAEIIYFPRPPVLLPSERRIGVQGQRYYKFNNPNSKWIITIDTPDIPLNAVLPDFTDPNPVTLSETQFNALASQVASELTVRLGESLGNKPVPIDLIP